MPKLSGETAFLLLLPCVLASVTLPTNRLFQNTLKRWDINILNDKDRSERWNRFIKAKEAVERTTSDIVLQSLNGFTVLNDEEFESLVKPLFREFNLTEVLERDLGDYNTWSNNKRITRRKRSMPITYTYWEDEVGLSTPRSQASCGSCWSFPNVGTIEALNTHLTGDKTEFSEQYFVDCTFDYSGCSGGTANDGYKITMMRQYMMSAQDWPYTAYYQQCTFGDDIASFKNNAMNKIWIQDWYPLSQSEAGMIEGLQYSPVAFGSYIGPDLSAYSGGNYRDSSCVTNPAPHSMLLVGYTETILRVKASYGVKFGDEGYINYVRGDSSLVSCNFYKNAYFLLATYRRELEYEYCNDGKVATWQQCRDSCLAMNTDTEPGWDLAVIPTKYHNQILVDKLATDYPGVKTDSKFNFLWIGLLDETKTETYEWVDNFVPVSYFNMTKGAGGKIYGLINKNTGKWITKSSSTYTARGLCSRAVNCWNIESVVKNGAVTFDKSDLSEGTVASVTCNQGKVVGASKLTCVGGKWDQDLPTCSISGSCTYASQAGSAATHSPNKQEFSNGEKITITCTNDKSTEHTCTDGAFSPVIAQCASNKVCTVVEDDRFSLDPADKSAFAEGEKLTITCVGNVSISETFTCSDGSFSPVLDPNDFCSGAVFVALSGILSVLSGLLTLV